jgi:hypothetical protein
LVKTSLARLTGSRSKRRQVESKRRRLEEEEG